MAREVIASPTSWPICADHRVGQAGWSDQTAPGVGFDVDAGFLERWHARQQCGPLRRRNCEHLNGAAAELWRDRDCRQAHHLHVVADQGL